MATKKKTKKKRTTLKNTTAKNRKLAKKTGKKKLAKKKATPKNKLAKKPALKKAVVKTKALSKKTAGAKTAGTGRKGAPVGSQYVDNEAFAPQRLRAGSAGQSGDLQGLSSVEDADSESVDELVEEGNAFEADVVSGVERAGDAEEKEVRTHEVPEDDVPEEYLDKE